MKTLKRDGVIKRVKNSKPADMKIIDEMVRFGWQFVPKNEWKAERPEPKPKSEKKDKKTKKSNAKG